MEEKECVSDLQKKCIAESIERNYRGNIPAQNAFRVAEGLPTIQEEEMQKAKILLGETFDLIKNFLSNYLDVPESHKTIIALWIIGTYMHQEFETYPYLFFNAMRGSGKSRTIKIVSSLAWQGQLLASLTESVLFRSTGTLAIDEFESIGSKEKQALRELLNAGYKKGIKIRRMKKVSKRNEVGLKEETQEVEEFDAYRPVVMANIWGMEEVLGDRCIQLILEKSNKPFFTKKVENFTNNPLINQIRQNLCSCVVLVQLVQSKVSIEDWNDFIVNKYEVTTQTTPNNTNYTDNNTTHNTYTTLDTQTALNSLSTQTTPNNTKLHKKIIDEEFFNKIDMTDIDGRYLELFFPIFLIARALSEDIFLETLKISKSIISEKRIDEVLESKDVTLFDFISRYDYIQGAWVSISQLTADFREFAGEQDDEATKWISQKWLGRALKRLSLIVEKRRIGRGVDVVLNKPKANEKMQIFHPKIQLNQSGEQK